MKIWRHNRRDNFDIFLPQHIYHKMLAYAKVCDGEISGWGKTKITKKQGEEVTHVTVVDIRIFKQKVTAAHTTLSTDVLTPFYIELAKDGEDMSHWNLWWHSHNDFGVFFSGEDEATIKQTASGRLYSICINKKGHLVARVDQKGKCIAEDIEVRVENPVQESLMQTCRLEVKKKVKREKFAVLRHPLVHYSDGFSSAFMGPSGFSEPFTPTHDSASASNGREPELDDERFNRHSNTIEWAERKGILKRGAAR